MPLRRRPKGPAGGQFSPEDRPDDPPVEADDLLRQVTDHAAVSGDTDASEGDAAEDEAASEPSEDETEIRLLRDHFRGRAAR